MVGGSVGAGDEAAYLSWLRAALVSPRWSERWVEALGEAVRLGADGDVLLAEALGQVRSTAQRVGLASALGDVQGPQGRGALLAALRDRGPGTLDVRCVAALSLARRGGPEVTSDLREALADPQGAVRQYAVIGLAGAGDDSAWDAVFERLTQVARRHSRVENYPEAITCIAYLAQFLDADRSQRLVRLVRSTWKWRLPREVTWLETNWPHVIPGGPDATAVEAPDAVRLRQWVREPIFRSSAIHSR